MKSLTAVLGGAATALGVLPGIGALAVGMGVPDRYHVLFGAAQVVTGVLVLALLYRERERFAGWGSGRVAAVVAAGLVGLGVGLWAYTGVKNGVVIEYEDLRSDPPEVVEIIFPLVAEEPLAGMIESAGGPVRAMDVYGRRMIEHEIEQPYHRWHRASTLMLLLVLYTGTLAFAVACLAVGGWAARAAPAAAPPDRAPAGV